MWRKEPPKEKYLIRFIDWDDTVLLETTLEEGEDIVPLKIQPVKGIHLLAGIKSFLRQVKIWILKRCMKEINI